MLVVCMPLFGFGLYFREGKNGKQGECVRYRNAVSEADKAYAYLYFIVGMYSIIQYPILTLELDLWIVERLL